MIIPAWGQADAQGVYFIALGLDVPALAHFVNVDLPAFLAGWMPINLLTYLFMLAIAKPVFGVKGFKPEVFYLSRILSSMFVTLPVIFYASMIVIFDVIFLEPRRRKERERRYRNALKDHGLEDFA